MKAGDLPDDLLAGHGRAGLLARWLGSEGGPWRLDFERWPPAEAQRWRCVLAVGANDACMLLAEHAPAAPLFERIESELGRRVRWRACDTAALDAWLASGEQDFRAASLVVGDFERARPADATLELSVLQLSEQTSPVLRLLDSTLYDALTDGASDLHFECTARGLAIRHRLDGVMHRVREIEGAGVAEQLVSRLKVMAELDIGERRLPQDGRFKLRRGARDIDFRLSIMPSVFGEDAVIRVLDRAQIEQSSGRLTLEALGLDARSCASIRHLASQPHGMVLVTGPTGSGKTTTLYAVLAEINTGRDKIVTIEDPVEYQLRDVVQIPVNEKKGLTFARGLRSILRHDPDRVMVGEIRDPETAQIAVQAALTGHLVFSTVHANNALDVIGRFMHMGLDLYHVVSALNGVVAQRLLRLNCTQCAEPDLLDATQRDEVLAACGAAHELRALRGRGCPACRGTGYRGRMAVVELLPLDDALRDLIAGKAPMSQIKAAARAAGLRPLRGAALARVAEGRTTIDEVNRVAGTD